MAKLVIHRENGKIDILTIEDDFQLFRNGHWEAPGVLPDEVHLTETRTTEGRTCRRLRFVQPTRVLVLPLPDWSVWFRTALWFIVGLLVHRWYTLTFF